MKVLKIIGIVLAILVAALFIATLVLPSTAKMERTVEIDAEPSSVYETLNSMKNFNEWSPWADIDPETTYAFSGAEIGEGSKMTWQSEHQDVGNGEQWIDESIPDKYVKTMIVFEGFEEPATAEFKIEPSETGTEVTWGFESEFSGLSKLFVPFMDGMLGPYYDKGLAKLKTVVESKPKSTVDIELLEDQEPVYYIGIRSEIEAGDMQTLQKVMGETFGELTKYTTDNNVAVSGMPLCIYHDVENPTFVAEPGFPTAELLSIDHEKIEAHEINAPKVVKAVHKGDYAKLMVTHEAVVAYIQENGLEISGDPWEVYVNDPGSVPQAQWETHVFYPVN